jgi:GntR family transcriptional repressor for pyruvate dehydrogenase complex
VTEIGVIHRRRLYQQVAEDVERLILDGTYQPGSRLPSEQELADAYGVSRNVVREALKSLKELGLVSIRTGSGTFVKQPSTQPVSEALNRFLRHRPAGLSIEQLYDVRRMIEPECARLAASRATEAEIQAIEAALGRMEEHRDDPSVTTQADLEFHLAIATATHNPLIGSILNPVIDPLHKLISASHAYPRRITVGLEGHRRVAEAIRARDPESAYQAMLDHLESGIRRYAGDNGLGLEDRL